MTLSSHKTFVVIIQVGILKLVVRVLSSPPLDALGYDGSSSSGADHASSLSHGPTYPSNHFDDTASEASRTSEDSLLTARKGGSGALGAKGKDDDSYVSLWWSDLAASAVSATATSSSAAAGGGGGAAGAAAAKREEERLAMRRARLNPPRYVLT